MKNFTNPTLFNITRADGLVNTGLAHQVRREMSEEAVAMMSFLRLVIVLLNFTAASFLSYILIVVDQSFRQQALTITLASIMWITVMYLGVCQVRHRSLAA